MSDNIYHGRFKDAIWYPKEFVGCIVGGAGGIGSWLTLLLVRSGFYPTVYDFDTIEAHNIGGQFFKISDLRKLKVEALKVNIAEYTKHFIDYVSEPYDNTSITSKFTFSCFDNMAARKVMFQRWVEKQSHNPQAIFIDGRLTMDQLQIFCVTPDRIEDYKKFLFDDSEVEDAPCTAKQTTYTATMIASHMVAFFINHYSNIITGTKSNNVPFSWELFVPLTLIGEPDE